MAENRIDVLIAFGAVGQGLFGTGKLLHNRKAFHVQNGYTWVYDCGTNSAQRFLEKSMSRFASDWPSGTKRPVIDLVVISHFDHDHISGLVLLLSRFRVRDLLLPYVPLWQRLEIAFSAGAAYRSQLTRFLLNPIAFVAGLREVSVERILFARAGGESPDLPRYDDDRGPDFPPPDENANEIDTDDRRWVVEVDADPEAPDEDEQACRESAREVTERKHIRVEYIRPGSAITVASIWEFIPYNDCELAPLASTRFKSEVAKLRNKLLSASNTMDRQDALDRLKDRFSIFGKTGFRRNLISLFIYAGPLIQGRLSAYGHALAFDDMWRRDYSQSWRRYHRPAAVMYTGDGFLNSVQRLNKLKAHLGAERFGRIDVLQVMHHGSSHNWYEGIAKQFRPSLSVFSSDPNRKRSHPHAEVVKDFLRYGPVQVDTETALFVEYQMTWGR